MPVPDKVKFALFALSNNVCGLRGCNNKIVIIDYDLENGSPYAAEAAHIKGEKPGSARYDPEYPEEKLNSLENLICLCPRCHKKIDKNPEKYPVELLLQMKKEHEYAALNDNISKVTFSELDVAAKALAKNSSNEEYNTDFDHIKIKRKIEINNLTDLVKRLLLDALRKSKVVEDYISDQAKLDHDFPNRLKSRFKEQFDIFSLEHYGDDLFFRMKVWIEREIDFGESSDILAIHAAAFLILCHLFEKCEVFKK